MDDTAPSFEGVPPNVAYYAIEEGDQEGLVSQVILVSDPDESFGQVPQFTYQLES